MDLEQEILNIPVTLRHPEQAFYRVVDSI
jgi:hypothetical protein